MNLNSFTIEPGRIAGEARIVVYLGEKSVRVEFSGLNNERLFENLAVGRDYRVVPYVMSRICGVCSHAHYWASNLALERALGIEVDEVTAEIRDVCNKLQIFENHLVHLLAMALPDYAELRQDILLTLLKTRATAIDVLTTLCGRLTNPQVYQPGGFTKELKSIHVEKAASKVEELEKHSEALLEHFTTIELPDLEDPSPEYVALSTWPEKSVPVSEPYALVGSLGGFIVNCNNYLEYFRELKPGYSKSKTCTLTGKVFFVGARARLLAKNYTNLNPQLLNTVSRNPYGNLIAKAIEARYVLADIAQRLGGITGKTPRRVQPMKRAGHGLAVVEAPRGLLLHYYELGEDGRVVKANVITPTVMFAMHVEKSAEALVEKMLATGAKPESIVKQVEKLVRSYDPCIPCAVHIVKLDRGGRT